MRRFSGNTFTLLSAALCFTLIVTACATTGADRTRSAAALPLWQSREQFVTIVPRESVTGDISPGNEHPLNITPDLLSRLLARPAVIPSGEKMKLPLFTPTELNLLSEHVSAGLKRCGAEEEIVFAIFGYHASRLGLGREERVTTGRIFIAEGNLNLVLGMVQKRVNSNEDRRLAPFTPGSRFATAPLDGTIIPAATGSAYQLKRADWLVIPTGQEPPSEVSESETTKQPDGKSVEERLLRLKSLREKNLITDEEFRTKRLQILNEL